MTHDAIVIGAGLSGLVCARKLVDAGLDVVVVEARERVGGRLLNGTVGGALVDLGGQWVTAGQHRLVALAAELGVQTRDHVRKGRPVIDERGGTIGRIIAAFAQGRAIKKLETAMRTIPPGEPMQAPNAAALDATTLAAALGEIDNALARGRIGLHADLVFAADPGDLSLLSYLATMRATGGFYPEGDELPGGGREHRLVGGAQSLAVKLAERLGDRVRLGEPIDAIEDRGSTIVARGVRGEHAANKLVLAIPPGLVRSLQVELPADARRYVDGVKAGPVVKCFVAYERAFWRDRHYSGEAFLPRGTVRAVVELAGDPPVLLAFVVGPPAAAWSSRDPIERRTEVIVTLVKHFGEHAARPLDYLEQDWAAEPYSAGCVAGTPPNVLAAGARWREPHGNLHLAGTETAVTWPGYMDGAIEAGERAAVEVITALGR